MSRTNLRLGIIGTQERASENRRHGRMLSYSFHKSIISVYNFVQFVELSSKVHSETNIFCELTKKKINGRLVKNKRKDRTATTKTFSSFAGRRRPVIYRPSAAQYKDTLLFPFALHVYICLLRTDLIPSVMTERFDILKKCVIPYLYIHFMYTTKKSLQQIL